MQKIQHRSHLMSKQTIEYNVGTQLSYERLSFVKSKYCLDKLKNKVPD